MMNKNLPLSYKDAHGSIDYGMTNDYMFRAVLQENKIVLKGLICSLLHLKDDEVSSVEITNPLQLGKSIDSKTFVLDIHVMLNNNRMVNLEMQMTNLKNWQERSLSYLCRAFDQLNKGEDYSAAKPAIHIGFLNFSATNNTPEFYSTYRLLNVKTHELYSGKFDLRMVDLTQIELATDEDKLYQIDYWARLFTAQTWEELKVMAENNNILSEATQTLYQLNADEILREQCRAREEYEIHERFTRNKIAEQEAKIAEQEKELEELKKRIKELEAGK